jgi:predicted ArsR family transcriptional regulator
MSETETGRNGGSTTDEDVLDVFETMEPPAATTSDVANILGVSTDVARRHLNTLHTEGVVRRRDTGAVLLWWRPRGDVERPDPVDMGDTDALEETEASHADSE